MKFINSIEQNKNFKIINKKSIVTGEILFLVWYYNVMEIIVEK